jgi:hypothetical protein
MTRIVGGGVISHGADKKENHYEPEVLEGASSHRDLMYLKLEAATSIIPNPANTLQSWLTWTGRHEISLEIGGDKTGSYKSF